MQTHEIIKRFREHFERNGHTVVPSASLILDDPTLLFVNAGMVPFKPYFLGEAPAPYKRATSVQKVVRTPDIDEVGKTTRHNTFFQMAGNFSFGDYFKEGAITLAWELITKSQDEGGYGLDPNRIWVTVYQDDDEAIELWQKIAGLPPERIQRRDGLDNYWDMGVPGPGGPCSEIYFDRGPEHGKDGGPVADEDRYLEIWNLVFMQDVRGEQSPKYGHKPIGELPARNIDTGMGVERVAMILQNVENVYETDLIRAVITKAEQLSGKRYGDNEVDDVRFRVIADHARSGIMIVNDGVTPGNEGRGYVLRRLLRRIVRSSRLLGITEPVLGTFAAVVRDEMGPSYPDLVTGFERTQSVVQGEENAFLTTLTAGSRIFETAADEIRSAGGTLVPGDKAFQLHDTYGFPIDLTLEMAAEQGLKVDEDGFRKLMAEQRARAKADAASRKTGHGDKTVYRELLELGATEFTGYQELDTEATVRGLIREGQRVRSAGEGEIVEVVLDRTSLYAESGGQDSDAGVIVADGVELEVVDVQKVARKLWVHQVRVRSGEVVEGQHVLAKGRPRLARRRPPGPLRHAHRARRPARGARPEGPAERLVQQARLPAAGLRLAGRPVAGDPVGDRGGLQPGRASGPAGARAVRQHRGGPRARGHRPVRRDLRRDRAHGGDRRSVVAGALRWHARGALVADRPDHDDRRVLGRLRCAPRRGLRRHGGLPLPGPGAGPGAEPGRHAQGARRRGAGPGRGPGRAAARGREGAGEAARRPAAVLGRHAGRQRRGPGRHVPRGRRPGGRGRQRPAHAGHGRPQQAGRQARRGRPVLGRRRQGQLRRGHHGRRPGQGPGRRQAGAGVRPGHRRPRRRQARPGPGRRHPPGGIAEAIAALRTEIRK
ncbi:alanyl-tRNA synthetase [Kutzneria sp. 744]|nr:alanyl-tRNA synthetase [Kutzneria sp. 744]